jgi:hypothetical protein
VGTTTTPDDEHALEEALRERRDQLEQSSETYLALADRLDDEIAALEAARRLARPEPDVDFEGLLDAAETEAADG